MLRFLIFSIIVFFTSVSNAQLALPFINSSGDLDMNGNDVINCGGAGCGAGSGGGVSRFADCALENFDENEVCADSGEDEALYICTTPTCIAGAGLVALPYALSTDLVAVTQSTLAPVGNCSTPGGEPCFHLDTQTSNDEVEYMYVGNDGEAYKKFVPSPYDAEIDVTNSTTPCADIQAAINDWMTGADINRTVRISGKFTLTQAGTTPIKYWNGAAVADGPYRVCYAIVPSRGANGGVSAGYPIINASDINNFGAVVDDNLIIDWDLTINWDSTGQTDVVAISNEGDGFITGFNTTAIYDGVIQRGQITINMLTDTDGGTVAGAMPVMTSADLFADAQTTIGFYKTHMLRSDESALSKRVNCFGNDRDDIGFVHQMAWGTTYNEPRAIACNVGFLYYASSESTIESPYFNNNQIGLALGSDNSVGGDLVKFSSCVVPPCTTITTTSATQINVQGGVIEGNAFNNILIMEANDVTFDGVSVEMSDPATTVGHGLLIGGGTCSDTNAPCGKNSECTSTVCETVASPYLAEIKMQNMSMPTDKGDASFTGLYIGEGAKTGLATDASLMLTNNVFNQHTGAGVVGGTSRAYAFDTGSNLSNFMVKMANNSLKGLNKYPDYNIGDQPKLEVLGSFFVDILHSSGDAVTADDCLAFAYPTAAAADVACTSAQAEIQVPIGTRWHVGNITVYPKTAPTNDVACDVEAALDTNSDGTLNTISSNPVLYGSANCDVAPEFCAAHADIDFSTFGNANADSLKIRLGAPNVGTRCVAGAACVCDEYPARTVVDFLPDTRF
jgi:hypothetical protein